MRTPVLLLTILALSITSAAAQQRHDITIVVDGVDRQFVVAQPSGAAPSAGYPTVFMFHGSGGDGDRFYNNSGWKELGEREGIVTVFPSALEYCYDDEDGQRKRITKWNCGELVEHACPGQTLRDDTEFVRAIIDTITRLLPIDRERMYASGFSNGGIFTSKLAIEMSDVFPAIAVSAGKLHTLDSAMPRAKIPVAYSIGSTDDRVTEPAGITELPYNDSLFKYVGRIVRSYLGAFELAEDYAQMETPKTVTYLWTTPLPGATARQFSFTLVKGLGHAYPNGSNHAVSAPEAFWNFFEANRGTSAAPSSDDVPLKLDLTAR